MGAYGGAGCQPVGGVTSPAAFVLVLFILLVIILKCGMHC